MVFIPTRLSSALTARLAPRSRNRASSCVPDQQLHTLRHHDRCTLQKALGCGTVFQMDKAKFTHQAFLRHFRERRENSNLDCRLRLRARRHHKNRFGARRLALHFFTGAHSTAKCNGESFGVEENLTRSSVAEYLSGARVEFILDPLDIGI